NLDCQSLKNVKVCAIEGLTYKFAQELGVRWLVRSVRNHIDFDYELQIAVANKKLSADQLETWLVVPDPAFIHINSSIVREIISHGNNCEKFLTSSVFRWISERS